MKTNFKKSKKIILSTVLFIFSIFTLNAQTQISTIALKHLDNFWHKSVELTSYRSNSAKVIDELEKFKNTYPYDSFSTQEKLIFDTFYIIEYYNCVFENKSYDASMKKSLMSQIEKNEAFIKQNKGNVSCWLYLLTSDCLSCYMAYSPISGALKYGLKVKDYFEECLKIEPKNSIGLTHYAQWFYWAPAINGGSKKKAKNYLQSACENAKTEAEKFYANLYYSQILFDLGEKDAASVSFSKSKAICPKSELVLEIENANKRGLSFFEYSREKSDKNGRTDK